MTTSHETASEDRTSSVEEGRSATSGPALSPVGAPERHDSIGWLRAIGTSLAIVVVAFAGAILGPNLILTGTVSLSRDVRVLLATGLALSFTCLMAWALRRLQARGLI